MRLTLVRVGWLCAAAIFLLLLLKSFVADVYRVSSGSMRPTIYGGEDPHTGEVFDEHVLVGFGDAEGLQRFDLVVVRREDGGAPMVKRVCGLPGESIGIVGGDLVINGQRLDLDAPRPAPVPVFDETYLDLRDYFYFAEDSAGPWTEERGEWLLDARAVSEGSDAGMMLFHKELLDDYLSVDHRRVVGRREANDARLECEAALGEGGGALRLRLVEAGDTFEARVETDSDGRVFAAILRFNSGSLQDPEDVRDKIMVLARAEIDFTPDHWYPLVFENIDNHLLFSVGEVRLTAGYRVNQHHAGLTAVGRSSVAARVAFGGEACQARFRKVRVLRDLCYSSVGEHGVKEPEVLGPDEFFVLGDNSSDSKDSRFSGPVRAEAVIGRPLGVVWPLGRMRPLGGARAR